MNRISRALIFLLAVALGCASLAGAALAKPDHAQGGRGGAPGGGQDGVNGDDDTGDSGTSPEATTTQTVASFSFDETTEGWAGLNAALTGVSKPTHAGAGALRITMNANAWMSGATSGSGTASWTPVQPGHTYRIAGWVRAASTSRKVQPVLTFYDSEGASLVTRAGPNVLDSASGWTALPALEATAPDGAAFVGFATGIWGTTVGEVHYLDTVSISTLGEVPVTLGVYDPATSKESDTTTLRDMEAWQQKKHAVAMLYTNWDRGSEVALFESVMPTIWEHGSVPMVSWMPWVGGDPAVDYNAKIAAGSHDSYIKMWTREMKDWLAGPDNRYGTNDDRRAYLRLAHEANGNWYPYSPPFGAGTPQSFVAMWRHVHDIFRKSGIDRTRLAWVWSVYTDDASKAEPAESMYPGDAYVDWIGLDGYNWGNLHEPMESWETPEQVFGPILKRLRSVTTRPLSINEYGATVHGFGVDAVNQWIRDYHAWARDNTVRLSMWFNNYPDVWMVFGGLHGDESYTGEGGTYRAFSAYREEVSVPRVKGPDASNPRILTDAEFLGS